MKGIWYKDVLYSETTSRVVHYYMYVVFKQVIGYIFGHVVINDAPEKLIAVTEFQDHFSQETFTDIEEAKLYVENSLSSAITDFLKES